MNKKIHTHVAVRLLIGCVILSLVFSGAVLYFKIERVDKLVLELALKELEGFAETSLTYFDHAPEHRSTLERKAAELLDNHFVIVEFYDRNQEPITETLRIGVSEADEQFSASRYRFSGKNTIEYQKFFIDQRLYLQALVPLKDAAGALVGYFRGVYRVDEETLEDIKEDVIGALVLVVAAVFCTSLMLYPIIISLNRGLIRVSQDLLQGNIELMEVLGSATAKRDSDTHTHNYRVTIYSIRLAEAFGLNNDQIQDLIAGALLHDIGKIGISDSILLKPGRLTDEEVRVMRTHVLLGLNIINKSDWLQRAREVIEFHHEKYDGTGYMRGLKGTEIPLNARIFAIADVFDALTSKRPYKDSMGYIEAMSIMQRDSGRHFDPSLLELFSEIAGDLYTEIISASEQAIEQVLNRLVAKHFFGRYQDARLNRQLTAEHVQASNDVPARG